MNMQPREQPKDGEDCFTLCISSILAYKGYSNFCSVWKQCGMIYTEQDDSKSGKLSPGYMATENDLDLIHQIKLRIFRENDQTKVVNHIKQLLQQGEPVIVWLDVFDMKYNSLYQLRHFAHCLLLSGYANEKFEYIDEFYHLKDSIEEQTLIQALDLSQTAMIEEGTRYVYNVVDSNEAKTIIDQEDIHRIIQMNIDVMNNTYLSQITSDHGKPLANAEMGLIALDRYLANIAYCVADMDLLTDHFVEQMYENLSEMSNNRYLFTYFLEQGTANNPLLAELIQKYRYTAQRWKLASNMALKSQYVDGEKRQLMLERILRKLEDIRQLEYELVETSEWIIKQKQIEVEMEHG